MGGTLTTDSSTVTLTLTGAVFTNGMSTVAATAVTSRRPASGLTITTAGNDMLTASDGKAYASAVHLLTVAPTAAATNSAFTSPLPEGRFAALPTVAVSVEDFTAIW